jgi:hypothetical protein
VLSDIEIYILLTGQKKKKQQKNTLLADTKSEDA